VKVQAAADKTGFLRSDKTLAAAKCIPLMMLDWRARYPDFALWVLARNRFLILPERFLQLLVTLKGIKHGMIRRGHLKSPSVVGQLRLISQFIGSKEIKGMSIQKLMSNLLACAIVALTFSIAAKAQNGRSFVSTGGSDTNNCAITGPCRTFTRALAVTNSGGEIIVLNSGGYGAATISQAVTISAVGVRASITATSGNAFTVTPGAGNNVTLRGLALIGQGTGTAGVAISGTTGLVTLYDMDIEGFNNAISDTGNGDMAVFDSSIRHSSNDGVLVAPATGTTNAYLHNCDIAGSGTAGVEAQNGASVTVADTASNRNGVGYFCSATTSLASLVLKNCHAINDTTGLQTAASANSTMWFAYCLVTQNTTGINVGTGSTLSGSTPGTNVVANNTTALVGTLSAPATLL
jgi:hypothetical protein